MAENTSCIHCPNHAVRRDPDPNDWFCDDDVKVVCTLLDKNITTICRPYNIEKESVIPSWCPKLFKIGDKVTYISDYKSEKGIVKSISDNDHVFVVYHCDGKWNEYQNYTAVRTRTKDLQLGWS